jgi:hypothetical protein
MEMISDSKVLTSSQIVLGLLIAEGHRENPAEIAEECGMMRDFNFRHSVVS